MTLTASTKHAVRLTGEGKETLVLVHGFGCDQTMWNAIVPHFTDRFKVLTYDLAGYGGAREGAYDPETYSTLQGHAEDLIAVLDDTNTRDAILIGHSVSAMTVGLVALKRPDLVKALVMICPSPSFINDNDYIGGFERQDILDLLETLDANYLGWSEQMAPAIMGAPEVPAMGARLTESFCQADPKVARHFARVTFLADHRKDVQNITHPTLVLQCEDDVIVPHEVGDWMQARMANATLVRLRATGHCPHISYPVATAEATAAFLETV